MQNNYLQKLKQNTISEEYRVLELKYAAKRFGIMDDNERYSLAELLLLKISTITGWTLPISELMNVLTDQFQKTLAEKYQNANIEEFEYAFRQKGIEIKDWGKSLNLSLIDEVMIPYLEQRAELSRLEEAKKNMPKNIEQAKVLSDEEKEEWIEEWKQKTEINIELIPVMFYDYLDSKKLLTVSNSEKWDYLEKAKQFVKSLLLEAMDNNKTNDAYKAWNSFQNMEKDGFTGEMKEKIINRSKKLIVYDYLIANNSNTKKQVVG